MRPLLKPLLLVGIALLVPIVPFVGFGGALETRIEAWLTPPPARWLLATAVAGILSVDILLPVPSSTVSTLGGAELGVWAGTAASWLGMTVGAAVGFALARWLGAPLARRLAGGDELARMERLTDRFGPLVLVLFRAVPVIAEASVLLLGATGLAWRRFLPPVIAANLGIALAWSAFGQFARTHQWLPVALGLSIAIPILLATMTRKWLPAPTEP